MNIDKEDQYLNWMDSTKEDSRREYWKEQRDTYGIDERETWNWGTEFMDYCYIHLRMYNEVNRVDLDYHKIDKDGEEITVQEAINIILKWFEEVYYKSNRGEELFKDFFMLSSKEREEAYNKYYSDQEDTLHLLMDIMPYLWW